MRFLSIPARTNSPLLLVLLVLLLLHPAPAPADEKATADQVIGLFMAPCCFSGTLTDHQSSEAMDMKKEIKEMVSEGRTADEIKAFYVARYGERILAEPPAEGINRLAVIMPVAVVLLGGLVLVTSIRRLRRSGPAPAPPERRAAAAEDDEIEAMIREDS